MKFIRRAVMRRLLRRDRSTTRAAAPLIVYDQSNDTFTVNGSSLPPNAGVAAPPGGRVRAILTPKAAASAPAPAPAGGCGPAAAPAPARGTGLRSSTTLGGEQRK